MKTMPDAVYANTDEIRAMLPEFDSVEGTDKAGLLQEEAGDIRDQLLAEAVASAMDIVWDSPGNLTRQRSGHRVEPRSGLLVRVFNHRVRDHSTVGWIRSIPGAIRGGFLRFLYAPVRIRNRHAVALRLNLAKVFIQQRSHRIRQVGQSKGTSGRHYLPQGAAGTRVCERF